MAAKDNHDKSAIFAAIEENKPKVLKLLLDTGGKGLIYQELDRWAIITTDILVEILIHPEAHFCKTVQIFLMSQVHELSSASSSRKGLCNVPQRPSRLWLVDKLPFFRGGGGGE